MKAVLAFLFGCRLLASNEDSPIAVKMVFASQADGTITTRYVRLFQVLVSTEINTDKTEKQSFS